MSGYYKAPRPSRAGPPPADAETRAAQLLAQAAAFYDAAEHHRSGADYHDLHARAQVLHGKAATLFESINRSQPYV